MVFAHLASSPDDYLLEVAVSRLVADLRAELDDVEPEVLDSEVTPEDLALELCSPSLFAPCRLIVVPDVTTWVDVPSERRKGGLKAVPAEVDPAAVVEVLEEGLPQGMGLVMGACCHSKPKGALASAVESQGGLHWHPLPPSPKPWEDLVVSEAQEAVLNDLLTRAAGDAVITPAARRLLIERLGFAPRALVQEGRKLASACGDGEVDEELVRTLSFPRERSLEVVWESVMGREVAPILDLLAAADGNLLVRDRSGSPVRPDALPQIVLATASAALQQLLYLRQVVARLGLAEELAPERTAESWWYPRHFSKKIAPTIIAELEAQAPSPLMRPGSSSPSPFRLGGLFKGASRYRDDELVAAVAAVGPVEIAVRGGMASNAVASWLTEFVRVR
jgi:hypothetical protein